MEPQHSSTSTPQILDDSTGSIVQLQSMIREFVQERHWEKYHSPKNLAMSIAIEAAELMEHFQWTNPQPPTTKIAVDSEVAQEIADILAYLLRLADVLGVDLTQALSNKMVRNRLKYPVDQAFEPKSI